MMVFFEQDWGKFWFGKNFRKRESPTLSFLKPRKKLLIQNQPPDAFYKKVGSLKISLTSQEKHLRWSLFLIKLQFVLESKLSFILTCRHAV